MMYRQEIMSRNELCICIEVYLKIQASIIEEKDLTDLTVTVLWEFLIINYYF